LTELCATLAYVQTSDNHNQLEKAGTMIYYNIIIAE
jgi:hypothetical protein